MACGENQKPVVSSRVQLLLILPFFLYVSLAFADSPVSFSLRVRLEMNTGKILSGTLIGHAYFSCTPSQGTHTFLMDTLDQHNVSITDDVLIDMLHDTQHTYSLFDPGRPLTLYTHLTPLKYTPPKSHIDTWVMPSYGVLKKEATHINPSNIKRAQLLSCAAYTLAPILKLTTHNMNLMKHPALALYTSRYGMNQIILILSYDEAYGTTKALRPLFLQFQKAHVKSENEKTARTVQKKFYTEHPSKKVLYFFYRVSE